MFLPYEMHDVFAGGTWGAPGTLVEEDVSLFGIETYEAYGVLILMSIMALITLLKRSLATSIVGAILGGVLLLGIPFLLFTLLFQLFGPEKRMGVGLAAALIVMLSYCILQIVNLIWEFRNRKVEKKSDSEDLLDSEF